MPDSSRVFQGGGQRLRPTTAVGNLVQMRPDGSITFQATLWLRQMKKGQTKTACSFGFTGRTCFPVALIPPRGRSLRFVVVRLDGVRRRPLWLCAPALWPLTPDIC